MPEAPQTQLLETISQILGNKEQTLEETALIHHLTTVLHKDFEAALEDNRQSPLRAFGQAILSATKRLRGFKKKGEVKSLTTDILSQNNNLSPSTTAKRLNNIRDGRPMTQAALTEITGELFQTFTSFLTQLEQVKQLGLEDILAGRSIEPTLPSITTMQYQMGVITVLTALQADLEIPDPETAEYMQQLATPIIESTPEPKDSEQKALEKAYKPAKARTLHDRPSRIRKGLAKAVKPELNLARETYLKASEDIRRISEMVSDKALALIKPEKVTPFASLQLKLAHRSARIIIHSLLDLGVEASVIRQTLASCNQGMRSRTLQARYRNIRDNDPKGKARLDELKALQGLYEECASSLHEPEVINHQAIDRTNTITTSNSPAAARTQPIPPAPQVDTPTLDQEEEPHEDLTAATTSLEAELSNLQSDTAQNNDSASELAEVMQNLESAQTASDELDTLPPIEPLAEIADTRAQTAMVNTQADQLEAVLTSLKAAQEDSQAIAALAAARSTDSTPPPASTATPPTPNTPRTPLPTTVDNDINNDLFELIDLIETTAPSMPLDDVLHQVISAITETTPAETTDRVNKLFEDEPVAFSRAELTALQETYEILRNFRENRIQYLLTTTLPPNQNGLATFLIERALPELTERINSRTEIPVETITTHLEQAGALGQQFSLQNIQTAINNLLTELISTNRDLDSLSRFSSEVVALHGDSKRLYSDSIVARNAFFTRAIQLIIDGGKIPATEIPESIGTNSELLKSPALYLLVPSTLEDLKAVRAIANA